MNWVFEQWDNGTATTIPYKLAGLLDMVNDLMSCKTRESNLGTFFLFFGLWSRCMKVLVCETFKFNNVLPFFLFTQKKDTFRRKAFVFVNYFRQPPKFLISFGKKDHVQKFPKSLFFKVSRSSKSCETLSSWSTSHGKGVRTSKEVRRPFPEGSWSWPWTDSYFCFSFTQSFKNFSRICKKIKFTLSCGGWSCWMYCCLQVRERN